MHISREMIDELWKIRLPILNTRYTKPGWIKETFLLPLVVLLVLPIMISRFDYRVILWMGLGYSAYLLAAIIIFIRVRRIKARRFRENHSYQISSLLYGIYAGASLMFLGAIFWDTGMLVLIPLGMISTSTISLLFICLSVIVLVAIISSPWFLAKKIKSNSQPVTYSKYTILALALAHAGPGLAVFIAAIMSHTGFLSAQGFAIGIMNFISAIFLITFSTIRFCEIILIGLRKWPDVHRTDSEFIVTPPKE